ncbi:hypothetical protein E4U42_004690 [Claviceps africana]|uniref:Uncharacterized protein n=1 Tax=Claviceps africana TaxID=83212 RepID=A0A8K0NI09_9HYPO|nr:hypothetical protein E4U42_004690 [Claviceps africana]
MGPVGAGTHVEVVLVLVALVDVGLVVVGGGDAEELPAMRVNVDNVVSELDCELDGGGELDAGFAVDAEVSLEALCELTAPSELEAGLARDAEGGVEAAGAGLETVFPVGTGDAGDAVCSPKEFVEAAEGVLEIVLAIDTEGPVGVICFEIRPASKLLLGTGLLVGAEDATDANLTRGVPFKLKAGLALNAVNAAGTPGALFELGAGAALEIRPVAEAEAGVGEEARPKPAGRDRLKVGELVAEAAFKPKSMSEPVAGTKVEAAAVLALEAGLMDACTLNFKIELIAEGKLNEGCEADGTRLEAVGVPVAEAGSEVALMLSGKSNVDTGAEIGAEAGIEVEAAARLEIPGKF